MHQLFKSTIISLLEDTNYSVVKTNSFLTSLGAYDSRFLNIVDRVFANLVFAFSGNILLAAMLKGRLGRGLLFKIHKNIFDHVCHQTDVATVCLERRSLTCCHMSKNYLTKPL